MAYFKTKRIHGQKYLYICETRLVDGKPRPVTLAYLGKADTVLRQARAPRDHLRSFAHGAVAVLLSLAERLGIAEILDRRAASPRPGVRVREALSVGQTLVAAAIGLAVHPTSKRGFSRWARTTTLPELASFRSEDLTSQFFWDQMDRIPISALDEIGAEMSRRVVEFAGVKLDTLFYDSTNFYTFIDSANEHCDLARRGHSKQKRHDLRQVNVGLLVARDGWIPLRGQIYRGNVNDVTQFPDALGKARLRLEAIGAPMEEVTLVCDKGNWSAENWRHLDASRLHYVTSVVPGQVGELAHRPLAELERFEIPDLGEVRALRAMHEIGGRKRTVVVLDSPTLRAGQLRGLQQRLQRPVAALCRLADRLRRGRRRSQGTVEAQVGRILNVPSVRRIVAYELVKTKDERLALDWWVDAEAYHELRELIFGRRVLVTDRDTWSTPEILQAYWGQSSAEGIFRALKDPGHCALHTPHHWTDQKLEVHSLLAVVAYTLNALIRREARRLGYRQGMEELVEMLDSIRVVRSKEDRKGPGRRRARWLMEETEDDALALYRKLALPQYDLGSIPHDD